MKKVYFISDAHLGSWGIPHARMQERRLVRFLDLIKSQAKAVYLLGDMFDFWYEWKYAVPKGYTRFLGKISELTDMGVEVHYFTGNHDIWMYGYLEEECGVIIHREPATLEIYNKVFYLAHGDGLGDPDKEFKLIRGVFHNKLCQRLFSLLHPRISMWFGLSWAKHSRMKRECQVAESGGMAVQGAEGTRFNGNVGVRYNSSGEPEYLGEDREHLVLYSKEYLATHPDVDYCIYGHRHIELDLMLSADKRMLILGDWITQFTYAVFDGEHLLMSEYEEGATQF
ncbi:UDP-2,3-diacylglucosamine diphosphatase [Prevotella sp. PINT]|jgi:Uncharacterized protein conserved in bacteria|uniref:UDP-2,3-diacylglucosamine diphosphatase n=1 Tax=Palleniella intestinalis TaxID=2736291 RepID=UPI0015565BAC|nr:UDP-2,3-diacylglucosamine diphosphatase [Palleniella intestinalis]NPD82859.1 UDP-2,3-diacylglucosamine diphosphatase [Palleniella intestinalis]